MSLFAIIAFGISIPFFIWITIIVFLKYRKSSDKYYLGYFVFFIILSLFQIITFMFQLATFINPDSPLSLFKTARFSDYTSQSAGLFLYTDILVRPLNLIIFIMISISLGAQIRSVEILKKLTRRYLSSLVYGSSILVVLVFIPAIRNSYYTLFALTTTITIFLIEIFFTFILSLLMAAQSTKDERKKPLYSLIGLFFYLVAMIFSTKIGWSLFLIPILNSDFNFVVGAGLAILSVIIYYFAFKTSSLNLNQ